MNPFKSTIARLSSKAGLSVAGRFRCLSKRLVVSDGMNSGFGSPVYLVMPTKCSGIATAIGCAGKIKLGTSSASWMSWKPYLCWWGVKGTKLLLPAQNGTKSQDSTAAQNVERALALACPLAKSWDLKPAGIVIINNVVCSVYNI